MINVGVNVNNVIYVQTIVFGIVLQGFVKTENI